MQKQGDGSVRLLNQENNRYLAWCESECNMGSAVSIISNDPNRPNAKFYMVERNDGQWALKASNGKYIQFCNGCISTGLINEKIDYVAMATGVDLNEPWAGFTFVNV